MECYTFLKSAHHASLKYTKFKAKKISLKKNFTGGTLWFKKGPKIKKMAAGGSKMQFFGNFFSWTILKYVKAKLKHPANLI